MKTNNELKPLGNEDIECIKFFPDKGDKGDWAEFKTFQEAIPEYEKNKTNFMLVQYNDGTVLCMLERPSPNEGEEYVDPLTGEKKGIIGGGFTLIEAVEDGDGWLLYPLSEETAERIGLNNPAHEIIPLFT